jgi:hypothetical protein
MFYSYSDAHVNPQLRGRDRLVISPRRGRHTVSADDCEESKTTPQASLGRIKVLPTSQICSWGGGLIAACPLVLGRTIT